MSTAALLALCLTAIICFMLLNGGMANLGVNAAKATGTPHPDMLTCDRCQALLPDDGHAHLAHDTYHAWMDALAVEVQSVKRS